MDAVTSCRYGRVRFCPFLIPFAIFIFHFGLIACQKRLTVPRFHPLSFSFSPLVSVSVSFSCISFCEGSSVYLANCEKQFSLSCLDSRLLLVIWWSVPKAFDLLCALCLCAAAHHGRSREEWRTHGSAVPALMLPARRAIRPGCPQQRPRPPAQATRAKRALIP